VNDLMQRYWKDFERLGEAKVREHLDAKVFGDEGARIARAWLDHKAQTRVSEAGAPAPDASRQSAAAAVERAAGVDRQVAIDRRARALATAALIVAVISAVPGVVALLHTDAVATVLELFSR
jgi:hypothetical protein